MQLAPAAGILQKAQSKQNNYYPIYQKEEISFTNASILQRHQISTSNS